MVQSFGSFTKKRTFQEKASKEKNAEIIRSNLRPSKKIIKFFANWLKPIWYLFKNVNNFQCCQLIPPPPFCC